MNPDWNELPRKLQSFAHIIDQLKIRVKWTSEKKNFQKNLMIALLQRWEKKNLVHSIAIHSHRLSCVQLVWSDDESIHFWVMIQCPISLKKKHNLHPTNRPYTTKAIELEGKKKTNRAAPPPWSSAPPCRNSCLHTALHFCVAHMCVSACRCAKNCCFSLKLCFICMISRALWHSFA